MDLTTNIKTHILVFKDSSIKYVNAGENGVIENAMRNQANGAHISGGYIDFKVVAKYLTLDEYHKQYPQNKPSRYEDWTGRGSEQQVAKIAQDSMALRGMIKGLERYIASTESNPIIDFHNQPVWYQGSKAPLEILAKMKQRLERVENGEQVEVTNIRDMMRV